MRLVAGVTQATDEDMPWYLVNQAIWAKVEADFAIISGESTSFRIELLSERNTNCELRITSMPSYTPPCVAGIAAKA